MDVSKDGYEKFSRLHAVFLASSIVTYLADVTLGKPRGPHPSLV